MLLLIILIFQIKNNKIILVNFNSYLSSFITYLTKDFKVKRDESGVLSIRDNLLAELDRLMYLFSLNWVGLNKYNSDLNVTVTIVVNTYCYPS